MHLVDCASPLSADEAQRLGALLTYGPRYDAAQPQGQLVLVAPRPGTTSPWSSKATDILHVCDLHQVRRVERGIAFHVCARSSLSTARAAPRWPRRCMTG